MKRISGFHGLLLLLTNLTSQHLPVTALFLFECKLVCSVLRGVDTRRIYSSIAPYLKFYRSIQITWKRKAAGKSEKSDLFEQAKLFAGATRPELTNTSTIIFSYPFETVGLFSYNRTVSSHSQKFFKIGVLKNFCKTHRKTPVSKSLLSSLRCAVFSKRDSDTGAFL